MVAGHFGSLHGFLDQWIRDLARALSRRKGFARTALEKQIRNRLGAALARRAARMSLATYPKSNDLNGITLPIVDYDDLDRAVDHASCTHTRVPVTRQDVHEPRWSGAASGGTARYPVWDTGRQNDWGPFHRWDQWSLSRPTTHTHVRGPFSSDRPLGVN